MTRLELLAAMRSDARSMREQGAPVTHDELEAHVREAWVYRRNLWPGCPRIGWLSFRNLLRRALRMEGQP